ncbi:DUF7133 domain-containing protein [Paraglaciecola sp.]|uniref:DUF7133 domain-containing protein n=1 Tax=Paraglaciecola sp. TaxID=1920173 RepID=UPI003EF6D18B
MRCVALVTIFCTFLVCGCVSEKRVASQQLNYKIQSKNVSVEQIAGNETVAKYMHAFDGRGIQTDDSLPTPAKDALKSFHYPEDLALDLVVAEPQIHQPVFINFDHRGRMWVVQYNQYPYPEGVKVVDIDNHNRAVFDKTPKPPGKGLKGADKITFFEDTDNDGVFDKSTDAISGLNIATSVTLGRGKIWVLTPPYLVAYPDSNRDGIPEGEAEVHLDGFGLQDTHAVANSLRWGPDGWLYGAQGSTAISTVNSAVSKNVHFKGQAFWRYHPELKTFEIYAEGGGNTFYVEIDNKGRFYSGTNEVIRGYYYKQGGYYKKNWGKHGALTNPYALGYLSGIPLQGDRIRFTHAWVKYEGGNLPKQYKDKLFGLNPLLNFVQMSRLEKQDSTFKAIDESKVLKSDDHWFRPVDIKAGPDGAVYIADWYDSRLSHVDPRDTWNKTTGRIYRLRGKQPKTAKSFDLSQYNSSELTAALTSHNKWFRQQALRQFGDRKDKQAIKELKTLFRSSDPQHALEALWAINLSGGLTEQVIIEALAHNDPYVRLWAVRLVGDSKKASKVVADKLIQLSAEENHGEVIGQLASSAKRLPADVAIPIISQLLLNSASQNDVENQMLIWWAIESKAIDNRKALIKLLADPQTWHLPIVENVILPRLIKRYALAGGSQNFKTSHEIINLSPSDKHSKILLAAIQQSIRTVDLALLPKGLVDKVQQLENKFGEGKLSLRIKQNDPVAIKQALNVISNNASQTLERLSYIKLMGQTQESQAVSVLTKLLINPTEPAGVRFESLKALGQFNSSELGHKLVSYYPDKLRADEQLKHLALSLYASRVEWAMKFLPMINQTRQVKKADVPEHIVRRFKLLNDELVTRQVNAIWPEVKVTNSSEKSDEIAKIKSALGKGKGSISAGKTVFSQFCGACHQLFGQGGTLGPDLTGYDRNNVNSFVLNIVDPNAEIREGYVLYRAKQKSGQVVVGILQDRNANYVVLKPHGLDAVTFQVDDLESLEIQTSSIMPERIIEHMSEQQIRDMFAYIRQ